MPSYTGPRAAPSWRGSSSSAWRGGAGHLRRCSSVHRRRCLARSVTLVSRQLGAEQHEDEEGAGEVALPRWRRQRRPLHPEQPQPWAAAPAAAPLGDPRQDSMPPHALTAALRAAPSWQHLHDLCVRHQGALNFIHASAALTTLAKLLAATTPTATDPPLLHPQRRHGPPQHPTPPPSRDLLACIVNTTQLAQAHAPEFQPRALANCLWATAKLLAWMARTYPAPPASHADSPTHAERPAPPAAPAASAPAAPRPRLAPGLTASADASLHSLALRLVDLLPELSPGFEPQHCSSALHALALVHGALLTDGGGAAPAGGREEQPRLDAARVRRAAADLLDVSLPLVPHMGPQALANSLHAAAQLELQPGDAWMHAALDALCALRLQQGATGPPPPTGAGGGGAGGQRRVAQQQQQQQQRGGAPGAGEGGVFTAQHLSCVMWALAKLQYFPGDAWIDAMILGSSAPATARYSPPPASAAGQPLQHLPALAPQALANTLWALGSLEAVPSCGALEHLARATRRMAPRFQPLDVAHAVWGLAQLWRLATASSPPSSSSSAPAPAANSNATTAAGPAVATPASLVLQALAMDVLRCSCGLPPAGTPEAALRPGGGGDGSGGDGGGDGGGDAAAPPLAGGAPAQAPRLSHWSPQNLANVAWAASAMRLRPPRPWLRAFWSASYEALPRMRAGELSMTLLALGRLRLPPPAAWWARAEAASLAWLGARGTARQLAYCAWAAARLGVGASEAWTAAVAARARALAVEGRLGGKAARCLGRALEAVTGWALDEDLAELLRDQEDDVGGDIPGSDAELLLLEESGEEDGA